MPEESWKIIVYQDDSDSKEKAYAFLRAQKHLVDPLTLPEGLDLAPWLWARITLRDIGAKPASAFQRYCMTVTFLSPRGKPLRMGRL